MKCCVKRVQDYQVTEQKEKKWRLFIFVVSSIQNYPKPDYVSCIAFMMNGDVITGDSSGTIYMWPEGRSSVNKQTTNKQTNKQQTNKQTNKQTNRTS